MLVNILGSAWYLSISLYTLSTIFVMFTWHCWKYWWEPGTVWPAWPFWNDYPLISVARNRMHFANNSRVYWSMPCQKYYRDIEWNSFLSIAAPTCPAPPRAWRGSWPSWRWRTWSSAGRPAPRTASASSARGLGNHRKHRNLKSENTQF